MPTHGRTLTPSPPEVERRVAGRRATDRHAPFKALDERLRAIPLSPREQEIAALVVRGQTNREIARRCFISQQTVKDHLKHVYRKLGVHTRTALIAELLGLNHKA